MTAAAPRLTVVILVFATMTIAALLPADPAAAAAPDCTGASNELVAVVDRLRGWLVGLIVALATLLLVIGGLRYLLAGGDPGEIGRAKDTLKYAAIGFGVAALAQTLASALQGVVCG